MKIVYFGSDVFLSCFEFLAEHHRVLALYTYHNEEDYFTEYAITRRAAERGIPIHYESISPEEIRRCFTPGAASFLSTLDTPAAEGRSFAAAFLQKSPLIYPAAAPFQIEPAAPGFDLAFPAGFRSYNYAPATEKPRAAIAPWLFCILRGTAAAALSRAPLYVLAR